MAYESQDPSMRRTQHRYTNTALPEGRIATSRSSAVSPLWLGIILAGAVAVIWGITYGVSTTTDPVTGPQATTPTVVAPDTSRPAATTPAPETGAPALPVAPSADPVPGIMPPDADPGPGAGAAAD